MLTLKEAKALTRRLDKIANHVQKKYQAFGMSKKSAYDFCLYIDQTSDLLEEGARRSAATLHRDEDEEYMDTFDFPSAPLEVEDDEPYMMHYEDDNGDQIARHDELTPLHDGDWTVESSNEENWYLESGNEENWYLESSNEFTRSRSKNWTVPKESAMSLGAAAKALSNYLNKFGNSQPDWYWTALEETGADVYFDEQKTDAEDPSYRSDIFVLCDGRRELRVEYFPRRKRWEVN